METKETEAALAQSFGFCRCIYCSDTSLGLKYWLKLFAKYGGIPVCLAKNGLDQGVSTRQAGTQLLCAPSSLLDGACRVMKNIGVISSTPVYYAPILCFYNDHPSVCLESISCCVDKEERTNERIHFPVVE